MRSLYVFQPDQAWHCVHKLVLTHEKHTRRHTARRTLLATSFVGLALGVSRKTKNILGQIILIVPERRAMLVPRR
jgi:hypothetical protein